MKVNDSLDVVRLWEAFSVQRNDGLLTNLNHHVSHCVGSEPWLTPSGHLKIVNELREDGRGAQRQIKMSRTRLNRRGTEVVLYAVS